MGRKRKIWSYSADLEKVDAHLIKVSDLAGFTAIVVILANTQKHAVFFARVDWGDRFILEYLGPVHRLKITPEFKL